ncbi:muscular LMNA-interacting protein [Tiliqua scincoides]|uniref:muscular LMNA-interacting protein n=1 Tax=Tiliqua scincoides TaxID=71010 RepID=UPI003462862B
MELGKHKRETSARDTWWKEKQQAPSESGFLRFTFFPLIGRLPTPFHVADAETVPGRALNESVGENYQEIPRSQIEVFSADQTLGGGRKGNVKVTGCTNSGHDQFQTKECNPSKGKMDRNDLFKAEFVFITDLDEDKTTTTDNGYEHGSSKGLDPSHVTTSDESRRQLNAPQLSHTDLPHSPVNQQKHSQFTSPLSTSDHLSHKSPVTFLLSPPDLTVEHNPAPILQQATSLQESHSQWQSANGSSIQQSSTYSQATASYSLPSPILKRPSLPLKSLSENAQMIPSGLQASSLHKISEPATSLSPNKSSLPFSQVSSSGATSQSSSPQALTPPPSKRFTALSAVPIYITTHLLSPSPPPLSSPFHGSSSTICSVNNPCSQMSSSGNLLKSGIKSPVPTRLSLLTAILKSGTSPKRPFSPASCPASFSPNSLGSSTPAIDQTFKATPPTPKKSASSFSIRSASPNQDDFHLTVFSTAPNHTSVLPSKSSPMLRVRSLSPKRHLDARALSPDKLRPLSPNVSSYRKIVVSPLLQTKMSNSSLPPHVPRHPSSSKGAHSPAHRTQGPEKSKRVHTYSPTFTAKSYPLSPATNQRDALSPTLEKYPSRRPIFMYPSSKSKEYLSQVPVKDSNARSPVPSSYWPFSHTGSTSPSPPDYNIKSPSPETNPNSVHSSYRACPAPARPRTPTVTQPRSPPMARSPCSLLSRSRELTSPLSFSLPSDSENKAPQPHKIKTSYKAFAAIPTNTLLLEQKALDEPTKTEGVVDTDFSVRSEMCSPAQLRQQTEELCAAIDQVLQDPLPMRRCDSSPSSLQSMLDSDISKTSIASQRPTGRETRFANLLSVSTVTEKQKTKPGVIRPTTVKAKVILKEEDQIQPNPFRKYLEESSDPETEQDSSHFHPFIPTKTNLSPKSPLHPQSISHADSLSPGPFSHLGSIFGDVHDHSYSPYHRNALYNKPPHPIVPIPENKALSYQELRSAREQNEADLQSSEENQESSKRVFPDHASAHSRAHYVLRDDLAHVLAKPS